jgi:hypothetical protein
MARHRPAHARSGFGRYTPPSRLRPAHAAPSAPSHLARRAGVLLGSGVLASAGLLGLSAGSASALGVGVQAPPTTCAPTIGTVDGNGNSACAIGTSGSAEASAALGGTDDFNNSALATIIGSLGGSATAEVADMADHSDHNVAIAVAAGGITVTLPAPVGTITLGKVAALAAIESDDAYRDSAVAVGNGDIVSLAEAGNATVGLDAGNSASASAGYLSEAVAAASNGGLDNFGNAASAIAQLGGMAFANAAGSVSLLVGSGPFHIANTVEDSTDNTADAAASLGGLAIANAGTGGIGVCDEVQTTCIIDQHHNTAQATANLGTATATAGGFKSYEYNNSAQAGVLLGGSATATAGTDESGGSNNTATASASFGGTATANVAGDTTGYAVSNSAGTTTTVTETDTSSSLSSSAPDAGGMGFGYDASGNWVASLNFNGTDKTFSNIGNG